jgi:hypothetical protein
MQTITVLRDAFGLGKDAPIREVVRIAFSQRGPADSGSFVRAFEGAVFEARATSLGMVRPTHSRGLKRHWRKAQRQCRYLASVMRRGVSARGAAGTVEVGT